MQDRDGRRVPARHKLGQQGFRSAGSVLNQLAPELVVSKSSSRPRAVAWSESNARRRTRHWLLAPGLCALRIASPSTTPGRTPLRATKRNLPTSDHRASAIWLAVRTGSAGTDLLGGIGCAAEEPDGSVPEWGRAEWKNNLARVRQAAWEVDRSRRLLHHRGLDKQRTNALFGRLLHRVCQAER